MSKISSSVGHELHRASSSGNFRQINKTDKVSQTCFDVRSSPSGVYQLQPKTGFGKPFEALCDNNYSDGGWTVIQYRFNGSVDFYRGWKAYEDGFGDLNGEFWLGLEKIHRLTSSKRHELLVLLEDFKGNSKVATYDDFRVADEAEKYTLESLGQYNGTAGKSLNRHLGIKFSTFDADNEPADGQNYVAYHHGAWWHSYLAASNLNGIYQGKTEKADCEGMYWFYFDEDTSCFSLKSSRMMIRPKI
ncbi:fibrinogen-like protein A [Uranotaenia lowii]|uniref:fibrinogen-like protein A n=1 Tax=Uranotaenia lowii TaxID=190385 RepID=UPI00247838D5|nr:fibrinogen-like protein A [Uranotaenia lowii]